MNGLDHVVLTAIMEFSHKNGEPPTQNQLWSENGSIINDWMRRNNVPLMLAQPISGRRSIEDSVNRLRESGLLTPRGAYALTKKGWKFTEKETSDWRLWTLE